MGVGDGAARIKGKIILPAENKTSACYLKIYLKKNERMIRNYEIKDSFDERFTVSPCDDDYFITINCKGYSDTYYKCCYSIGGTKYYESPIDIGEITLKK